MQKRYLSKSVLLNLLNSTGIAKMSQNSVPFLTQVYLQIVWTIVSEANRTSRRQFINGRDVMKSLKAMKAEIPRKAENKLCKEFSRKVSDFKSTEDYQVAKQTYYRALKNCEFVSKRAFQIIVEDISKYGKIRKSITEDALDMLLKAADKKFKRFLKLVVLEFMEEGGRKVLNEETLKRSWRVFQLNTEYKSLPKGFSQTYDTNKRGNKTIEKIRNDIISDLQLSEQGEGQGSLLEDDEESNDMEFDDFIDEVEKDKLESEIDKYLDELFPNN